MSESQPPTNKTCPPFDARKFRRQMIFDDVARWAGAAVIAICIVIGPAFGEESVAGIMLVVMIVAIIWVVLSNTSAKVWRRARPLAAMIEQDPAQAEGLLADLMARKPLQRQVRLGLLHRLAVLRHRQQRFAETDAICRTLLDERLGPALRIKPHLLLMLVEVDLLLNAPMGAYQGLVALSTMRLNLVESLQRLTLQTQYELAIGNAQAALHELPHKVAMSELMPANQCGAMHRMLARAADHAGRDELSQWLSSRATLIAGE